MIDLSSKTCRCYQIEASDLLLFMQKLKEQEQAIAKEQAAQSEDD